MTVPSRGFHTSGMASAASLDHMKAAMNRTATRAVERCGPPLTACNPRMKKTHR